MKIAAFILFLFLGCHYCKAQDSTVYFQKDAAMFSNKYVFYSDGSFKHYFMTDDLQLWYGEGTYIDERKTRTLYFKDTASKLNEFEGLIIHYEINFQRILIKKNYGYKSFEKNANNGKHKLKLSLKRT